MDDALLVSRAAAGDLESFGQLYDAYVSRIYDFAWRVLLDAGEAAGLTADVFAEALRDLRSLPRDQTFRIWLFHLAYRSALARGAPSPSAAGASDAEAFGAFGLPDPSRIADPSAVDVAPAAAALGWDAAAALSTSDRAFLDLHLRQGLSSSELAPILGVSAREAAVIVTRMKAAARDVMTGYIVARSSDCDVLRGVIGAVGIEPYTQESRVAVAGHVARCATCQAVRRNTPDPLEMYSLFAPVDAPLSLKGDIWNELAEAWSSGMTPAGATPWRPPPHAPAPRGLGGAALAGATFGGSFGGGDVPGRPFATTGDSGWDRRRMLWFAAAAAGIVLFAFACGAVLVKAFGGGDGGGGGGVGVGGRTPTAAAARSATPPVVVTPGVAIQTPTPNLTPSATPAPSETATPPPPPPPPPTSTQPPATPTISVRTVAPFRSPTPPGVPPTATPTPRR